MNENIMKEIVDKAKKAVEHLDEPYRTKAFEIVLNKLLNDLDKQEEEPEAITVPKSSVTSYEQDDADKVMSKIDRTKYPLMFKLSHALDLALYTLLIVREQCGLNGLTASQVSKILTDKFRLKATPSAIGMALKSSPYVDRTPIETGGGTGYCYKLMHAGEEYLKELLKSPSPTFKSTTHKATTKNNSRPSKDRKEGLKSRILALVEKQFFEKPCDATEVRQRLRDNGFPYDLEPIRTTMLRLVKKNQLRRIRESKGNTTVYKYVNP
ncbi:Uncharacterised protein [uncultured archaeon]|nr:Uncharacterised protein [uncultured archaeon]